MYTTPLLARCYANLYAFFNAEFGVEGGAWEILKVLQSFGFFMALAFIAAAIFLYYDLKRKEKLGLFDRYLKDVVVGKPASTNDLIINAVLGFLFGYKLLGLLFDMDNATADPQAWMLSTQGSFIGGLVGAILMAGSQWHEKNKQKLDKPQKKKLHIKPHEMIGDITMWAAIGGILGAKFFYLFESAGNFSEFLQDPFGSFFGGLTIYGGLIGGTICVVTFAYYRKINIIHLADSVTSTLFLAYGIGRLGCQVAGDGDWGINNPAPNPYSWLPDWLWSYKYPHNVGHEGIPIPGCVEKYCHELAVGVYPTPLYEFIASLLLFGLLYGLLRKRITIPGIMLSLYMILNGIERFLIEKIRVTPALSADSPLKQADVISVIFVIAGIGGIIYFYTRYKKQQAGS